MVELAVWSLMFYGAVICFELQLDWDKGSVRSRTGVYICVCLYACVLRQYQSEIVLLFQSCSIHLPPV